MSHHATSENESAHGHPAFGNAMGILMGLLVWWIAAGGVTWLVYKLLTGGEPE